MTVALDPQTRAWWTFLRGVSVLNLALLAVTLVAAPIDGPARRAQLVCATLYVVVCAFRSFFPRVDLERTVLVDHWASSIALGRTAATIAEMSFTVQCALLVARLAPNAPFPGVGLIAWSLVPLIAVAQGCCWLGVLTLQHVWHAAEEALWGVMMALLAVVFVAAWPSATGTLRFVLPLGLLGCAAGAFVMLVLDVPMYLRRWRSEVAAGRRFLGVGEGLADALRRRQPTGAWEVWRHEIGWMTPYFSVCVWLSLALVWW